MKISSKFTLAVVVLLSVLFGASANGGKGKSFSNLDDWSDDENEVFVKVIADFFKGDKNKMDLWKKAGAAAKAATKKAKEKGVAPKAVAPPQQEPYAGALPKAAEPPKVTRKRGGPKGFRTKPTTRPKAPKSSIFDNVPKAPGTRKIVPTAPPTRKTRVKGLPKKFQVDKNHWINPTKKEAKKLAGDATKVLNDFFRGAAEKMRKTAKKKMDDKIQEIRNEYEQFQDNYGVELDKDKLELDCWRGRDVWEEQYDEVLSEFFDWYATFLVALLGGATCTATFKMLKRHRRDDEDESGGGGGGSDIMGHGRRVARRIF